MHIMHGPIVSSSVNLMCDVIMCSSWFGLGWTSNSPEWSPYQLDLSSPRPDHWYDLEALRFLCRNPISDARIAPRVKLSLRFLSCNKRGMFMVSPIIIFWVSAALKRTRTSPRSFSCGERHSDRRNLIRLAGAHGNGNHPSFLVYAPTWPPKFHLKGIEMIVRYVQFLFDQFSLPEIWLPNSRKGKIDWSHGYEQ